MAIDYEIIVKGNILGMREGFLALANFDTDFHPGGHDPV